MSKEKTLRDEIAMSMPIESLPQINNMETMSIISKKLNLAWSDCPFEQMEWAIKYASAVRYIYADAMLEARDIATK